MLVGRFEACDWFVARERPLVKVSLDSELGIFRRGRFQNQLDQPRPVGAVFLLWDILQRKKAPDISIGARIDVILQAVAFRITASFDQAFGGRFVGLHIRLENQMGRSFQRAIVRRRQWIIGAAQGMSGAAQIKRGPAGRTDFPDARGRVAGLGRPSEEEGGYEP